MNIRTRYILALDIGIMDIETMDILTMDTETMDIQAMDEETMDTGTMEAEAMDIKARVKGITDIGTATGIEQIDHPELNPRCFVLNVRWIY
jgi:hypothetical protein